MPGRGCGTAPCASYSPNRWQTNRDLPELAPFCVKQGLDLGRAGLLGVTFHGLRHSFVAILVAAGCNVREVSEWAGHNNVAFTLTRYGGLFEDGSDEAVSRLDALLS